MKIVVLYAIISTVLLVVVSLVSYIVFHKQDEEWQKALEKVEEDYELKIFKMEQQEKIKDKLKREYDQKKEDANTGNRADDVAYTVNELQKLSGKRPSDKH